MSAPEELVGAGSAAPNVICDVCSATFHTAAVSARRPCGRCQHCRGPLSPIVADAEREIPHRPAGVYDLEAFRKRRR